MTKESDLLSEAREAFEQAADAEERNRNDGLDDLKFSKLSEQWPQDIAAQRAKDKRPCLTSNRMNQFIRQVVNDGRQNKPSINVHPVDSTADPETAQIMSGLIRNIEYISQAQNAYDTALDFAASMGWGYLRVALEYAHDDTFDKDLLIERVANPFTIYGDPFSTSIDGSDWNVAFITDLLTKEQFTDQYKGAEPVDWDDLGYSKLTPPWLDEDRVLTAEYWKRTETQDTLLLMSDGSTMRRDVYEQNKDFIDALGVTVQQERPTRGYKVCQYIMTGAEVLEENDWAGKYIPLIPVYGDEVNIEGRRYFKSLIRDAKDEQRMFNYWRTTATELVALSPRAPWVGPEIAFQGEDSHKWETANTENYATLAYKGQVAPIRQPFDGTPIAAISEALSAADNMKAIMGIYDAALGARSNETSGKAINARKVESDVSNFHFIDNLSKSIARTGRILIDLIPHVYTPGRALRVLGVDGKSYTVQTGQQDQGTPQAPQPAQPQPGQQPQPAVPGQSPDNPQIAETGFNLERIYDLGLGKYDLTVDVGPSYQTQREAAADQMTQLTAANPQLAQIAGDIIVEAMDFPEASRLAARIRQYLPPPPNGQGQGIPPELQQQIQAGQQQLAEQAQTIQELNAKLQAQQADKAIDAGKLQIDARKAETDQFKAETDRALALHTIAQPPPQPTVGTVGQA